MEFNVKLALHPTDCTGGSYKHIVRTEADYCESLGLEEIRDFGNFFMAWSVLCADLLGRKVPGFTRLLRRHQGIQTLLVVQFHPQCDLNSSCVIHRAKVGCPGQE